MVTLPSNLLDQPQVELELVKRTRLSVMREGRPAFHTSLNQLSRASIRLLPGDRDRVLGKLEMGTIGMECSWGAGERAQIEVGSVNDECRRLYD